MHIEDGLNNLLAGRYDEALAVFEKCESTPQTVKLCQLTLMLSELSTYAAELAKGNLSVKIPDLNNHAVTDLKSLHAKLKRLARQLLMVTTGYFTSDIDYMGDLSEGLNFLVTQTILCEQHVDHSRNHDLETGLLNRKAFMRAIHDILSIRPHKVGVLFCCSLDNIKYINEIHGYDNGDIYINQVVDVLRRYQNDSSLLARLGGNEFAVYAHGFDSEKGASQFVYDNFKGLFNTKVIFPHEEVKIRVSCGMAIYPHDATTSDILMSYANHAMFEVKDLNRGTIMRFSPEVYRTKAAFLSRQERLDELIEGKLIHFAFQPIVSLQEVKIIGYEALMRPKTANFTAPLDILSLAEAQSKLSQLEKATFEIIFEWIYNNMNLLEDKKIFFNAISAQFLDVAKLREIHPHYKMISQKIVFEILETAMLESELLQRVNTLRQELSALIAIDDFGCGYSNAIRLITLSPDILKIDRFFINSINNAPATQKEFLSHILDYCRARGIRTLAEGVETREEVACVIQMGFDYAQGFYLGQPQLQITQLDPQIAAVIADLNCRPV